MNPKQSRRPKVEEMPLTMSVPQAGKKFFNFGRNGSYEAARRGDLIVIPVGRLLRVPVQAQMRKLEQAK